MTKTPAHTNKLLFIDCLRGLAVLMVIATHLKGVIKETHPLLDVALSFGRAGVQLFFIVSAFTLYLSWINRRTESRPLVKFYTRRFFRIAPLYYFGIALYGISACYKHYATTNHVTWPEQFQFLSIASNLLMLHGFYPPGNNNIVPGGWSIGTEFLFYLLFPYLMLILNRFGNVKSYLLITGYISSLILIHLLLQHTGFKMKIGDFWYHSIFNQLSVFLLGIIAAISFKPYTENTKWFVDVPISLGFLLVSFLIWNSSMSVAMSILPLTLSGCFIFLTFLVSRFEEFSLTIITNPLAFIGRISFSMYIWHFIIIDLVKETVLIQAPFNAEIKFIALFLTVVIITTLVSFFSEKHIESRGIQIGKRFLLKI